MMDKFSLDPWKVIQNDFNTEINQTSESLFSLGNGRIGGRGNHIIKTDAPSLQGNYIAGIYYPDKTKVGWWKNGYPEYFAKVINSVNCLGVEIELSGEQFVINQESISDYESVLDMQTGLLSRTYQLHNTKGQTIQIKTERFFNMALQDQSHLKCSIKAINFSGGIKIRSLLDFNVRNQDSNYDESFWDLEDVKQSGDIIYGNATTKKTKFRIAAGIKTSFQKNDQLLNTQTTEVSFAHGSHTLETSIAEGEEITVTKNCSIVSELYYSKNELTDKVLKQLNNVQTYSSAYNSHSQQWAAIWKDCDISITGDVAAQQGIRYNIFHLYQTYRGDDARLNIGPKGFTGEKYGGVTYWDTEAYCLPFYMSTTSSDVARNLLKYRYNHLERAIENAAKLGFKDGAALYPMVTMNGEECHNEWEITFEEIHRNAAIAHAIYNFARYTDDKTYLQEYGIYVLIGIARFWSQRVNWSAQKNKYVMLGVTGPNEYENNVNNNWYTNYAACWCMRYCLETLADIEKSNAVNYSEIINKTSLDTTTELGKWKDIIEKMYFPRDEERNIFLQQDGFLDKELIPAKDIPTGEYPIHQNWSWDRILRSCFIKQADVLQGLYFFEDHFDKETIKRNFDFYEPLTVHESSLSPCVHSILAASIGYDEKAYEMYLRTARLDLEDYNHDTKDGLHITSMAGTWMALVNGFGGMRVQDGKLHFNPIIPKQWDQYEFKINFRNTQVTLCVNQSGTSISTDKDLDVIVNEQPLFLKANQIHKSA